MRFLTTTVFVALAVACLAVGCAQSRYEYRSDTTEVIDERPVIRSNKVQ